MKAVKVKPMPWRNKGGVCVYCGQARRLTVDHIEPVSRGGSNDWSNKAPACTKCNSSKGTLGPLQFLALRGGLGRKSPLNLLRVARAINPGSRRHSRQARSGPALTFRCDRVRRAVETSAVSHTEVRA